MAWDLDEQEARELVEEDLAATAAPPENDWVVHDVAEFDWGWVVYWVLRSYYEGDRSSLDIVAGNGPYLVDRKTGRVAQAGTAHPVEHYVRLWRSGQWPDKERPG